MTKEQARKKLEKEGYDVVRSGGSYLAKKGQRTYTSDTLNGLVKKIF
jgi:predicted RNA binding protein YcfA (HicA-like mRNA interferase family)